MHGDIECFHDGRFKHLKKGDTLIAVGNFGFLWNGGKKEQSVLKWIGKRKYQVLFVEGWYENYDELEMSTILGDTAFSLLAAGKVRTGKIASMPGPGMSRNCPQRKNSILVWITWRRNKTRSTIF